jgi:hypothetical protein
MSRPTQRLAQVADLLIPAGAEMPSASGADPAGMYTARVLSLRPDLAPALERALERSSHADTLAALTEALTDDAEAFATLTFVVAAAYFLNPDVRKKIGYPGQVAQPPVDDWTFGIADKIERVRARGPMYRPAPAGDGTER